VLRASRIRYGLTATHKHADSFAVSLLDANARGLVVTGMNEHHVRCIDITF
jgi:hypothetical protein